MKITLLITILTLLCSGNTWAASQSIHCLAPGDGITVVLDPEPGTDGTNEWRVISNAHMQYEFTSSERMTCMGFSLNLINLHNIDFDCVGFYFLQREVALFKIRTENQRLVAHWKTSVVYGSQDKTSECTLQ